MARKRNVIDSLAAGGLWMEMLLRLFWTLDEAVKNGDDIPAEVMAVYQAAERARKDL